MINSSNVGNSSRYKITRDHYSNFESFKDGSSVGTSTDETFTKCNAIQIGSGTVNGADHRLDNFEVK